MMLYSKQRKRQWLPGGHFHLEEEKTKTRVWGYGHGDDIKLKDEYGNVWRGSATRSSRCATEKETSGRVSSTDLASVRANHDRGFRRWKQE